MRPRPNRPGTAALLAAALLAGGNAEAAQPAPADLAAVLEKLTARIERLEQRNAELEKELRAAKAPAALEERVKSLEEHSTRLTRSLDSDVISENEPELVSRLKAVESQTLGMLKAARTVQGLEGLTAGVSLTTVAQRPHGLPPGREGDNSQLNYRGDVFVTLPFANIGDIENRVFAQFRMGQGSGVSTGATYSRPNATAFRAQSVSADDAVPVVAQAWYQANIPLPLGGHKPHSREALEVNFGKMDPFVFFDQNAIANDETRQFLNSVFVHNPLLDAGGDIGVDANGFTPGLRVSYFNERTRPENWRLSLGVLGAGQGANYTRTFSSPVVIVQAETQLRLFEGLTGNYRLYAWRNGQATAYDGAVERHTGWGVSADQRFGDAITVFGRFGQQIAGRTRFDRALTLGAEVGGSEWARGGDALGLAFGWLRTSSEFHRDSASLDADLDGVPDLGYTTAGFERVFELYYRYRISKQFELSPDLQLVYNPGGDLTAKTLRTLGLRAQLTF